MMRNNIIHREKFSSYLSDELSDSNRGYNKWETNESKVEEAPQGKLLILNIAHSENKEYINDYIKKSQRYLNYTDSGNFSTQSSPKHLYSGSLLNASA